LPDTLDGLKDRPEARNLVNIYAACRAMSVDQVVAEFAGAQFGTFKPALADLAVAKLSPITTEMNRLMARPGRDRPHPGRGADRAEAIARAWLGSTVFDGARYFDGMAPDLALHCVRVNRSAEAMQLTPTHAAQDIEGIVRDGLKAYRPDQALYIRPMYWGLEDDGYGLGPHRRLHRLCGLP
jgi:hypothetical protein